MYVTRIALGICSYGVLFAMCCIVCTGVRQMKQADRKGKVRDAFFTKRKDQGSREYINYEKITFDKSYIEKDNY